MILVLYSATYPYKVQRNAYSVHEKSDKILNIELKSHFNDSDTVIYLSATSCNMFFMYDVLVLLNVRPTETFILIGSYEPFNFRLDLQISKWKG